jgi:hypothetical protein
MREALAHYKSVYLELRLWARLAIPVAVILAILYLFLAFQFFRSSSEKSALQSEISELSKLALISGPSPETLAEELASQQSILTDYKSKLDLVSHHTLLQELYAESSISEISLQSVSFGDQRELTSDDTVFLVQPVALTLQGPWENLRRFLSGVQLRRPALSVGGVRASDVNALPTIQLQLAFYLSANEKEA